MQLITVVVNGTFALRKRECAYYSGDKMQRKRYMMLFQHMPQKRRLGTLRVFLNVAVRHEDRFTATKASLLLMRQLTSSVKAIQAVSALKHAISKLILRLYSQLNSKPSKRSLSGFEFNARRPTVVL